ncbi:hypothetical protein QC823_09110 [Halomonas vilamensis]|uniref:PrgI family protein n=1 Tax=Vreelandella vilamensis TaxID=531309 RepID=A0ABU1H4B5_9GAMM|nr:hypothetical protein [Halomonas vilamensis]MDR5899145.1 hypothetical protein [Halomonas vilamensis]
MSDFVNPYFQSLEDSILDISSASKVFMKTIFVLALGTIAFFLAISVKDSTIAQIFLASLGVALCMVALTPGSARRELRALWRRKPSKTKLGEGIDLS